MQPPLDNDTWTRRGISLLWDSDSLAQLCRADQVLSIRDFLQYYNAKWPEDMPLINDRALIVAGLETCIDALPPDESTRWLEQVVYPAIISFQREVADGGSQAALIFWFVEQKRIAYRTSEDAYFWHCGGEHKEQQIPLSHSLFNGAQRDLCRIVTAGQGKSENWIGLFHPRIS